MKIENFVASLLIGIFFLSGVVYSAEYKVASPFVRVTTNMLGYNFIAKKIAQSVLKKTLKKSINGEYKVKFDSFSGVDLKKGKFKGLTIEGKNLSAKDEFFISRLYLKTTSDFNYVDYKKDPIVFMTDLPMAYEVELSESDLNKNFVDVTLFNVLSSVIPLMRIEKPTITIANQRIKLKTSLKMPLAKPIKFSMSTGLKVEDGKIVLSDMESSGSKEFAEKMVDVINQRSLLESINLNIFDNTDTTVMIKNVKIQDKKVFVDGLLTIKKSK